MQKGLILCCAVLATLASAWPAAGQIVAPQDTLPPADTIPREGPLPRTAFLRALVVPGWGHATLGEYRRGAVYFTLQATSATMLGVTLHRLSGARDAERGVAVLAHDSLALLMAQDTALARELENPAAYEQALLSYPGLADARGLVRARERHRQDWIVYTLVTTFASAVDAYVAAHLADFPARVGTERSADGGVTLRVGVPVGGRR